MNPLAALIGAGGSLLGGFLNTSSIQAINTQNIQEQQWAAQGGYLPGLVANAAKAGLSPLAVLGQHAPSMGTSISGQPGAGVADAAKYLSQIKDPHDVKMEQIAEELGQRNIERIQAETSQMKIDTAKQQYINRMLSEGESTLNRLNTWSENAGKYMQRFTLPKMGSEIWGEVRDIFGYPPQNRVTVPLNPRNVQ